MNECSGMILHSRNPSRLVLFYELIGVSFSKHERQMTQHYETPMQRFGSLEVRNLSAGVIDDCIMVRVTSLEKTLVTLRRNAIAINPRPVEHVHTSSCYVEDPDGRPVLLVQAKKA